MTHFLSRTLTYLLQCRAHHWAKNIIIFFPVFFAGDILASTSIPKLLLGFASFSLIASGVYTMNDIKDLDFDRNHPVKRFRPLAAGRISLSESRKLMVILMVIGVIIAFVTQIEFGLITLAYLIINFTYSYWLKHISIIDVTLVAIGFNLRIFAGGILADIAISEWLVLLTFLLAVFLAISKRRDDLLLKTDKGIVVRKAVDGYNLKFIDISLAVIAGVMLLCYISYTLSDDVVNRVGSNYLYITIFPAIIGLLRYIQLVLDPNTNSLPVEILYRDWIIRLMVVIWIVSLFIIFYIL